MRVVSDVATEPTTLVLTCFNKRNHFISSCLGHLANQFHASNTPVNAAHFEVFVCKVADRVLVL